MKRRFGFLLVAVGIMIGVVALAPKDNKRLLILDWAEKAKFEAPLAAVLIEMGLKDTEPTAWSGKAGVAGAKVVRREGYRFRKDDKLTDPDGWEASSHRPIRSVTGQPAVARLEGLATVGVVLHLGEVKPDATLTVEAGDQKATVILKDVLAGKAAALWEGKASVRLITTATPIAAGETEDDFPAACYAPNGNLWVAYISYHLKEKERRVEAPALKEQPANFKAYQTPGFGDQLFVQYYHSGRWSKPLAVTGPNEDLVRCAIAAEGNGNVWVAYSANRNGNYDIYARKLDLNTPEAVSHPTPNVSPEEQLTSGTGPDIGPVMCTTQKGELALSFQSWSAEGGAWIQIPFACRDGKWTKTGGQLGKAESHGWHPALAAAPQGRVFFAYDLYFEGDYDLRLKYAEGDAFGSALASGIESARFEARPSICCDNQGRLWIAYEEGPEKWGKDYGAFEDDSGEPLYSSRSVRVVCLEEGKLKKPVAELPTSEVRKPKPNAAGAGQPGPTFERASRYSSPQIGIDGKGRIWLSYRMKYGSRYTTHAGSYWLSYARRLDGDKWSEPIEIHHSDGLLDYRPVLLPHKSGGLLIVHNSDGRYTVPETVDNQVYLGYVNLPGDPVEPMLAAHDPGQKNEVAVKEAKAEQEAVKRIRDYRVKANGKEYQLLRGEFHRHTEVSWDGGADGSLEDMFRYAIDAAGMDWIGNGDHDNGAGREYSWWLTQKLTDAYHVKNVFTPMFTYERSVSYPHGHRNCMFAQRGVRTLPRLAEPDMQKRVGGVHADDAKMLYRYLHELKGICAGHTAATGMGTDWRDNDPVVEPFVEIYQGDRMSYEYPGCPRAGFDPKGNQLPAQIGGWQPAGFIDNAFKKGYRLGFQASSDHWSTHISYCIALAERHDREAILDAYRKRHCYGATDDIIVDVRSGNHLMGDEFKTSQAPKLEFTIVGTRALKQIDILKDSQVVDTIKPNGQEHKGTWTDPKPTTGTHYYYLRVLQVDDEIAWASPMWIEYGK